MNKTDFIVAVKNLSLDQEDYIVIGSGILCALEIREADDIDIVVSKKVFDRFEDDPDWKRKSTIDGTFILENSVYELGLDRRFQNAEPTLEGLKKDQIIVDDVPFINLDQVVGSKLKRGLDKDLVDIGLVKQYLNKKVV